MRARPAPATSLELPDEPWLDGFALKFFGAVRLTRLFWPLLKASEGHVVNIIGGAARTIEPEFLIGGSVNAATANFTKGLSQLGMRDGVQVNAIHPGQTATERTELLMQQRAAAQGNFGRADARRHAVAKSGIRRMSTPEDIAALALFLCSESRAANPGHGDRGRRRQRLRASIEELHLCERRPRALARAPAGWSHRSEITE